MCYSATVSFTVGAVLGGVGIATLASVRQKKEILLATIPLFFACQQITEGWIWVNANQWHNMELNNILSQIFLFFAFLIWPILLPANSFLIEQKPVRKKIFSLLFIAGLYVAIFHYFDMITPPPQSAAKIIGHSIYYDVHVSIFWRCVYFVLTCFPLLFSSFWSLRVFGITATIAVTFTLLMKRFHYISIWCFWSALLSVLIYLYFNDKILPSITRSILKKGPSAT